MISKIKVIVIGPKEAGKSLIANIITDMSENIHSQYEPTEGVRILEAEIPFTLNSVRNTNIEIEIWDCGGSQKFHSCWPIMQLDTHGVIFVYNSGATDQIPELELLYDYFVTQNGLNDFNCMIFSNEKEDRKQSPLSLPHRFDGVKRKIINAANNPNGIKTEFLNFMEILLNNLKVLDHNIKN